MHPLPETGFVRLSQIIGRKPITEEQAQRNRVAGRPYCCPHPGLAPIIPVSASTWWAGVRSGRYPKPIKLGRSTVWRVEIIHTLIEEIASAEKGMNSHGGTARSFRHE